jgi:hypothetical protein
MSRILGVALAVLAAGLLGAGCAGGGSGGDQSASAGPDTAVATDSSASGGPCDGNPCIGDWHKEAAEGGSVVQCNDGTWSHAGGLSGACSDHGGESDGQASSSDQSATTYQPSPGSSASGGPCDGNPCIGDWQKEAAEGGSVVQCNDGTWSHAGGISGACSDHGGESSRAPAATAGTAQSATSASPPAPSGQALPVQCGYGVSSSSGVTCAFAENAFYEYWQASGGDPTQGETISVWSAEAQQSYQLSCGAEAGVVDCTGANATGVSLDARFTQDAVSAYTTQQAAAYAASGKLGPTPGSEPSSTLTPGDQNPNDANASECEATMEIGPHSDCFVAQQVASDLAQGTWSAPGSDTVSEGTSTITFECTTIGQDNTQDAQAPIYRCVSQGDPQDWFEFEFT